MIGTRSAAAGMKNHRVEQLYYKNYGSQLQNLGSVLSFRKTLLWAILSAFATVNLFWYIKSDPQSIYLESKAALINAQLISEAASFCSQLKYRNESCDLSKGRWVRDLRPPLYTNETCKYIYLNQNCMKNGRPDREYLYWRWKPRGGSSCDVAGFNATIFLQLMRGKKMLFVGDSIARNHMESLLCALSQVETPTDLRQRYGIEAYWKFPSFDFTLSQVWSPFLVSHMVDKNNDWKLYLDEPEPAWTRVLDNYDVAIFSTTYWFFRKSTYYLNRKVITTFDPTNSTSLEFLRGMQMVWRSVLKHVVTKRYKGVAVVRTVSASHFEGDAWDKGGVCKRKQPYMVDDGDIDGHELEVDWTRNEIRKVQRQEFHNALDLIGNNVAYPTLRLLDITYNSFLRPDGHPSTYRIQSSNEPKNDCVHWCMPGPIDAWNSLILSDPHIMCRNSYTE